jgi:hypothetical protein
MLNVPFDVMQHENPKRTARILDAGIMRIERDVHHGCRVRTDARGAGLSPAKRLRCSGVRRGSGIRVACCGVDDMAAHTPGWRRGVKPRSREAVRQFPQGFTRDESPGEDECEVLWVERGMARW